MNTREGARASRARYARAPTHARASMRLPCLLFFFLDPLSPRHPPPKASAHLSQTYRRGVVCLGWGGGGGGLLLRVCGGVGCMRDCAPDVLGLPVGHRLLLALLTLKIVAPLKKKRKLSGVECQLVSLRK